jgi:hypothetical protein
MQAHAASAAREGITVTAMTTPEPTKLPPRRRRRYGWWIAGGIVAALIALVVTGWILYAEPIRLIAGWMFTGNPYLPGCRTTIVSETNSGSLWTRTSDMSCADRTIHVVFVKRSDGPLPVFAFASVDGPTPISVRETGGNEFEIVLATPLADGRSSVPFKLDQNGSITKPPQIFDRGRPLPVSEKTDFVELLQSRIGEHRQSH